jgi:heterodisulfide reductase subunit C
MNVLNMSASFDEDFVAKVRDESEQNLSLCYQCGNCTAGCPYTFAYDIPVNQIMRLVQAGQKRKVLECRSLWLCATCESCTTRCPNGIDVARVMDVLRHIARCEGHAPEKGVKVFWDSFLGSVRKHGRVFEVGLLAAFIGRTGRVWTDIDLAPRIMPKGKLSLTPHPVHGKQEMDKIFKRFEEQGGCL